MSCTGSFPKRMIPVRRRVSRSHAGRKSLKDLIMCSPERLGLRKVFPSIGARSSDPSGSLCFSVSGREFPFNIPPGGVAVLSGQAEKRLRRRFARRIFLRRIGAAGIACLAFAEDREPSREIQRFCKTRRIFLFVSSFDEPYLISRIIGLIREKVRQTVVVHGVLINLNGLGLLIAGKPGTGKTTCGLNLAGRGHTWIADDCIEVTKRGDRLWARGYGSGSNLVALRREGIMESRLHPDISRTSRESSLDAWCELAEEAEGKERGGRHRILGISLPYERFPSFGNGADAILLIEQWVQKMTVHREGS